MLKKQIPEDAVGTYEKIKNSLKGENYTYESFEVTKVADSDRGKRRLARSKRTTVQWSGRFDRNSSNLHMGGTLPRMVTYT